MSTTRELTVDIVKDALPLRANAITEEVVELINQAQKDPEFQGESLLQTAVTYESILKGTKHSIKDYLNSIRFCAFIMGQEENYVKAFTRTFYYRDFVKDRKHLDTESSGYRELTSAASRYRKSKLVRDILTLSQMPLDLMFTGYRYKAVGVLASMMVNAKFDKDRINAAKELLAATKNEDQRIQLEIGPTEAAVSMQEQLNKQLCELALTQKKRLGAGHNIKEVQKVSIDINNTDVLEGEVVE